MKKITFFCVIVFFMIGKMNVGLYAQTVRYVKPVAEGIGDGSSWNNASADLSAMLTASGFNDEVWIAAGTYTPGDGSSRSASFVIPSGVKLYGGFAGDEISLNERDPEINHTILSGEIGAEGYQYDNIKNIITIDNSFNNILDGLIIQNANCNRYFSIIEPVAISGMYSFLPASGFGATSFSVTGEVQQAEPLDACNAVGDLAGKIALIQRGSCTFVSKALLAQNAGAIAVIIFNNVEGDIPLMGGTDPNIVIPVIAISLADGESILAELNAGHIVTAEIEAGQSGGGMKIGNSNPIINNCTFKDNVATYGSAIYSSDSYPDIANCQFFQNSSTYGTIFNYLAAINIEHCYFNDNYSQYGGAIYASSSDNTIKHCVFDSNRVDVTAGAIYSYLGESIIDSCSFTGNNSQFAGAIDVAGNSALAMINYCYFADNKATGGGAGVIISLGKTSINNCFLYNNIAMSSDSASGSGGCIQLQQNAEVEVTNSVIANNQAGGKTDDGGGGIMVYGGNLLLDNVTLVNNKTGSLGGAIRIYDSSGAVMINNSILWNNTAVEDSADCIYNTGGMYFINYSDIQDEDLLAGDGNMNIDPLFVNSTNPPGDDGIGMTSDDGLMLQVGSPLIGSGVYLITSTVDILGNPRSNPPSIGAYEGAISNYSPLISDNLFIYPNPSTGIINLYGSEEITNIIISNIVGQIMWTGNYDSFPLNISDWKTGIYIIRFKIKGGIITKKLIKE